MTQNRLSPIEWLTSSNPAFDTSNHMKNLLPPIISAREDGELSDEAENIEDVDYNILPRPTTQGIVKTEDPKIRMGASVIACPPDQYEGICSDEEASGSSSSDSDSDEPSYKKRSSISAQGTAVSSSAFRNPNAPDYPQFASVEAPTEAKTFFEEKMLSFQQQRKVNNVWADVLQEEQQQQALEKLGSIDVDNSKILVERGPESYAFKPNANPDLKRKRNAPGIRKTVKKRGNPEDSEISSTGLSDDDLEHIKKACSDVAGEQGSTNGSKKKIGKVPTGFHKTARIPLPKLRNFLRTRFKGRKLSYFMADELEERKKQLVVRAVDLLGKPYCIRLFIKTLKIERKGGLMIKNQSRRRTPGGVFFYMLRKDSTLAPELVDQVFAIDKEITAKEKKAAKAARRLQRKAKLEKKLVMEKMQAEKMSKPVMMEDGEVESSLESLPSYESESPDSEVDAKKDAAGPECDDELSNDYLDIYVEDSDFDEL